jgi:taurine dioxygenase
LPSYLKKAKENPTRRPLTNEEIAKLGDVYHHVLCQHPETGENLVFANEAHTVSIENRDATRASAILKELFDFCYSNGPDYVHNWRSGDVIIWDNRSVIHKATEYDQTHGRHIWRISIAS